jgi:hypothetical protein
MAQTVYTASSGATFWNSLASPALQTAITAQSSATDHGIQVKKYRIGFNGVTASNTPVLIRVYTSTLATAGASSAGTVQQVLGRVIANGALSSNFNYTSENTVKTYTGEEWSLTPNGGTVIYDYPLGDELDYYNSGAMAIGLEITPAQQVGVAASVWFTRI